MSVWIRKDKYLVRDDRNGMFSYAQNGIELDRLVQELITRGAKVTEIIVIVVDREAI